MKNCAVTINVSSASGMFSIERYLPTVGRSVLKCLGYHGWIKDRLAQVKTTTAECFHPRLPIRVILTVEGFSYATLRMQQCAPLSRGGPLDRPQTRGILGEVY